MRIDFEITYRGETVNLDETSSQMVISFTLYDGNFPINGGGGAVDSVNGKTGTVVLNADDIAETATRKWLTATLKGYYDTAYSWVNTNGASVLQSISDLTTALGNKVDKVTGYGLSKNDLTDALKSTYDGYASQISAKANKSEVPIVLFASTTKTIITGKTAETAIYAIPLPMDGVNYEMKIFSQAQNSTFAGSSIIHRIRVGIYASPIDGAVGADSIGQQTLLAQHSNGSSSQSYPITRNYSFFGGASGSIFGFPTNSLATDEVLASAFITLATKDFSTQHYLYISFNPSNVGAIVQHSKIYVTAIRV